MALVFRQHIIVKEKQSINVYKNLLISVYFWEYCRKWKSANKNGQNTIYNEHT